MPEDARLSGKQHQVIALLVQGETILASAATCNVNESTIRRWKKTQAFRDAMHQAQDEMLKGALSKLARVAGKAIDCLETNLQNETGATAQVRAVQVRAAQALLDAAVNVHRADEIDRRLEALEQQA